MVVSVGNMARLLKETHIMLLTHPSRYTGGVIKVLGKKIMSSVRVCPLKDGQIRRGRGVVLK